MESALEADTTVLAGLDIRIRCGNPGHDAGTTEGCVPGEFATRLMVAPCCRARAYVCEGRAVYLRTVAAIIHCHRCGLDHPNTAYRFPPIEVS